MSRQPFHRSLPRGDGDGTWKPPGALSKVSHAIIVCPGCGMEASVGKATHSVAADGTVTPSVVCPHVCPFHEWIRLEDWPAPPPASGHGQG